MAFTYFFRDLQTLELAVENLLPAIAGRQNVRIWDAGCAMGPEPYTLAILLAERMGRFAFRNLRIDATDIDGSNLFAKIIEDGIYAREEVERIPADLLSKYFTPASKPDTFQIDANLRARVSFQKHDLLTFKAAGSDYSLIVCKNVLLHFSPEERIKVYQLFHSSMAEGGLLINEQTQKLPQEVAHLFEQVTNHAQLFRKVSHR